MEVSVAVVELTGKGGGPGSLRVLIREPGPSGAAGEFIPEAGAPLRPANARLRPRPRHLPRTRLPFLADPAAVALRLAASLAASLAPETRGPHSALRVPPLNPDEKEPLLFCTPVPALHRDEGSTWKEDAGSGMRWESLEELVHLSLNNSSLLDAPSRHLILRLEEWLGWREAGDAAFRRALFLRPPVATRLGRATQNPAHLPALTASSSELEEEKRRANEALARMMALEKCDVFILNPLFGFPLPYRLAKGQAVVAYAARGRPELSAADLRPRGASDPLPSASSSGSGESGGWGDEFPIHYAAYLGKPDRIRQLLAQGTADPNLADRDSWTPVHYAAWYGQLSSMRTLLNYGNCTVNARTRNGSTALHFAAWCGRVYLVELLLTHPSIDVTAKDSSGKTPLDFCDCVPKQEWQDCGKLLRAAASQKLPKVSVELADGSNVMCCLVAGAETTAAELQTQVRTELGISPVLGRLFALWISSPSLELQLKAEHKPVAQLAKWKTKILPRWSEAAEAETPALIFRRDAKVSLAYEKKVVLTDTVVSLLYHEAHGNYVRGLYPCSEADSVLVAALTLHILHGPYDAKATKAHLANERTQARILPLQAGKKAGLLGKVAAEHKELSSRKPKSISALQYQFLSFCWNLRVYGSAFFNAIVFMSKPVKGAMGVVVGVNDFGLHLLQQDSKQLFHSYPLASLSLSQAGDKPFLEVKANATPAHVFTLRTRQAAQVATLVNRLAEGKAASSQGSSATDLSSNR